MVFGETFRNGCRKRLRDRREVFGVEAWLDKGLGVWDYFKAFVSGVTI